MAINRWSNRSIKATWSIDDSDDDEEKVKFLMSSPEPFSSRFGNDNKEEIKKANSRNKLIDLLGAEYLSLLNEFDDDLKQHKRGFQTTRNTRVGPKPHKKRKRSLIAEEPEDDTFNEEENLNNYKRYHHIGVNNWGEDSAYMSKKTEHKRRGSAPILTIPKR